MQSLNSSAVAGSYVPAASIGTTYAAGVAPTTTTTYTTTQTTYSPTQEVYNPVGSTVPGAWTTFEAQPGIYQTGYSTHPVTTSSVYTPTYTTPTYTTPAYTTPAYTTPTYTTPAYTTPTYTTPTYTTPTYTTPTYTTPTYTTPAYTTTQTYKQPVAYGEQRVSYSQPMPYSMVTRPPTVVSTTYGQPVTYTSSTGYTQPLSYSTTTNYVQPAHYTSAPSQIRTSTYSTAPVYTVAGQSQFVGYNFTSDAISQHALNLFNKYDFNNDGYLTWAEARPMFDEFCDLCGIIRVSEADKSKLFTIFDLDNNRGINFNEFRTMLYVLSGQNIPAF